MIHTPNGKNHSKKNGTAQSENETGISLSTNARLFESKYIMYRTQNIAKRWRGTIREPELVFVVRTNSKKKKA